MTYWVAHLKNGDTLSFGMMSHYINFNEDDCYDFLYPDSTEERYIAAVNKSEVLYYEAIKGGAYCADTV